MHNGYRQCCFLGYGLFEQNQNFFNGFRRFVDYLITNKKVGYFNFGSRSDFDDFAHRAVTIEQKRYPGIVRVAFPLNNELVCPVSMKNEMLRAWNLYDERIVDIKDFDTIVSYNGNLPNGPTANRIRNHIMIDNSDIVVTCIGKLKAPDVEFVDGPRFQTKEDYEEAVFYARSRGKIIIEYDGSY